MKVLLYGARPRIKGGGERYFEELAKRLPAHVQLTRGYFDEEDAFSRDRFDVLHATTFAPRVASVARRCATAFVTTFHISPWQNAAHGWRSGRGGFYRVGQAAVYARELASAARYVRKADRIIAVSPSTAEGVRRNAPFAASRIRVVENGVDVGTYTPSGLDKGYGLFVGRLERVKGPQLALAAFRELGFPLKIVGQGSLEGELREAAKGADVEIITDPSDEELVWLYQDARLAVFPSANEGYPFVVLEALACGTPVVSSRSFACGPPVSDLVHWVPVGDADALRDAVRSQWKPKSPSSAAKLHEAVARDHSWDAVVKRTLDVYADALGH